MKPYYQDDYITIYHKDCRDMSEVEGGSVDLVLTDPPWMISQEVIIHRSMNPRKYKYTGPDISLNFGKWDSFETEEEYMIFTTAWLREAARCLKEKGHLISFFDQSKMTKLIDYLRGNHFIMRQHLYWLKTNPVPRARKVDFMVALEQACWFTKGTKSGATFNYRLGQQRNYVESCIPGHTSKEDGQRVHPTQKPLRVLKVWINYLTNPGEVILDPMFGGGSTLIAAKTLNRKAVGYEIDERYCEIAANRCRQMVFKL